MVHAILHLQSPGKELNPRSRRIRTMCFRYTTRRNQDGLFIQNDWIRTNDLLVPNQARFQLRYVLPFPIDPCGIRTQPNQFEGLATSPEVERALSVYAITLLSGIVRDDYGTWAGRRSNPSLLGFSQALNHLSYQPRKRESPVSFE